jgi:hypothetical protein
MGPGLKFVDQWEKAGYYVCPWFMHVEPVSIVPALVSAGREDITMKDGTTLSFSAMATLKVSTCSRR